MEKAFLKREKNGIIYFVIPSFEKTGLVAHAFSGRTGGVSVGTFESLNLSILTDDALENVLANRKRFCAAIDLDPASIVGAHQVHKDKVYRVTGADRGAGGYDRSAVIQGCDALITNEKGLTLTAFFADCVPLFFLDPKNKAIGLAHAGWKGTVLEIAKKTVQAMIAEFGSNPAHLLAAIGPSIGPCCYKVDRPVLEKFREAFPGNWPQLFSDLSPLGNGRLDLWKANERQLEEAGVLPSNITTAELCTLCHRDIFFSHRGGMSGRQAAMIALFS